MAHKYVVGLDIGTTGAKGAVIRLDGKVVSEAYREYICEYPRPNWVEQDVELIVGKALECCKEAVGKSGLDPAAIASLAISAQRCCAVFVDGKGGLVRPMISWQDNRTHEEVEEIRAKMSAEEFYDTTGMPLTTTWIVSKILWVRKNEPEKWKRVAKVVQLQDYALKTLGAEDWFDDVSDAGFYGLWNPYSFEWSGKLLSALGLDRSLFPKPSASGTRIGAVSPRRRALRPEARDPAVRRRRRPEQRRHRGGHRAQGLPVSFAGHRRPRGRVPGLALPRPQPQGHGGQPRGVRQVAAGGPAVGRGGRVPLVPRRDRRPGEGDGSQGTARTSTPVLNEMIAATPAGAKGLVLLPYLASATTPRWNPHARGTLLGLTFAHDRALPGALLHGRNHPGGARHGQLHGRRRHPHRPGADPGRGDEVRGVEPDAGGRVQPARGDPEDDRRRPDGSGALRRGRGRRVLGHRRRGRSAWCRWTRSTCPTRRT